MIVLTFLFLALAACILGNAALSMHYACIGLELWFQKMIPALLPFMILSGIMIRLGLTEKVAMLLYPVVGPLYRIRKNVVYAMMLGFLCGFPMGAKVTADLYDRQMITRREAEYLLAFCNNIGPVYFCSFALPLLGRTKLFPYLFGMYGLPLLYGLLLRFTFFRDLAPENSVGQGGLKAVRSREKLSAGRMLRAIDDSVKTSLQSILSLGGYMILFNLLNLLPHMLLGRTPVLLAPLLEITGGLSMLDSSLPLYSLLVLSFGGLSCIAQTYSCIGHTDLSVTDYIRHKVVLTVGNALFYLLWFLLCPASFLR